MSEFIFKDIAFEQCGCLGKGKSGISYLVRNEQNTYYVIKQIHHEPCSYYQFGNKLEAELHAYHILLDIGLNIPKLFDVDYARELILKEYIEGPTIAQLVETAQMKPCYIELMREMAQILYKHGLNIDYFPTNFVVRDESLFYIDYEFNAYNKQWDFDHWGIQYWQND